MSIERESKIKENKKEMRRPCKKKEKEMILAVNALVRNLEFSSNMIYKQMPKG